MISAVTGLPAIIIESLNNVEKDFDYSSKPKASEQSTAVKSAELDSGEKTQKATNQEEKGKKVNYEDIQKKLQETLRESNLTIEFSKDKELNKMIIKMIDSDTNEIVRQLPPDVALKIARIVSSNLGSGQIADTKI